MDRTATGEMLVYVVVVHIVGAFLHRELLSCVLRERRDKPAAAGLLNETSCSHYNKMYVNDVMMDQFLLQHPLTSERL